ncbi:Myb-like DNA-binding protein [Pseudohyphozyma bogoriensis]|nr:Myb-like DNA-binding protein [Pseudohyphozyma bogoriensis]
MPTSVKKEMPETITIDSDDDEEVTESSKLANNVPLSRRGSPWTKEENALLEKLVNRFGGGHLNGDDWKEIAEQLGTDRTWEACRTHWHNLRHRAADTPAGPLEFHHSSGKQWSAQEVRQLMNLKSAGKRWAEIGRTLKGRSAYSVKKKYKKIKSGKPIVVKRRDGRRDIDREVDSDSDSESSEELSSCDEEEDDEEEEEEEDEAVAESPQRPTQNPRARHFSPPPAQHQRLFSQSHVARNTASADSRNAREEVALGFAADDDEDAPMPDEERMPSDDSHECSRRPTSPSEERPFESDEINTLFIQFSTILEYRRDRRELYIEWIELTEQDAPRDEGRLRVLKRRIEANVLNEKNDLEALKDEEEKMRRERR